jgi:hypothetical protein
MPETEAFMGMLTACASGASTEFDANLLGSIKGLYEGQQSKGFAKLKTQTGFMELLPEKDKLEGYRLYTECIRSIVANPKETQAELQRNFLDGFDFSTTLDKVKEVFGAPAKSRDGFFWFEGKEVSFFVELKKSGEIARVATYSKEHQDKARIPMLNMGRSMEGKVRKFYNLGDFKFKDMPDICGSETIGKGHARFAYKISEPCYFGRPGGYMNYVFVFRSTYEDDSCSDNFMHSTRYDQFHCASSKNLSPIMALIYPNEDANAHDQANSLMEWIYRF